MNLPDHCRPPHPSRQRGAASVAIAVLIMFILAAAVAVVMNMSGSSAGDAVRNQEQVSALFLAESGLERAHAMLKAAPNAAAASACQAITGNFVLDSARKFSLSYSSSPTGCATCTSCTVTSTGTVGSSSRSVTRVYSVTPASGGATGFGGGGCFNPANDTGTPANPVHQYVPTSPCPWLPPDLVEAHKNVVQSLKVTNPPAILLSNMAYTRKSPTTQEHIYADPNCVLFPAVDCATRWNTESNHSIGANVVGSRGAQAKITNTDPYTFTQNLTGHANYAAISGSFGGSTLAFVGAYWDDNSTASGTGTASGSAQTTGTTNNGAGTACSALGSSGCPTDTQAVISPLSAMYDTKQTGTSWCYDADTLVLGFSGKSDNAAGAITSFRFGSGPNATALDGGFAAYPAVFANDQIYSTMYWLNNPYYRSTAGATSYSRAVKGSIGATVTGTIGSTFQTNAEVGTSVKDKGKTTYTPATSFPLKNLCTNCLLSSGDTIIGIPFYANDDTPSTNVNPTETIVDTVVGTTVTVLTPFYAPNNTNLTAKSKILKALTITNGQLCGGDTVYSGAAIPSSTLDLGNCSETPGSFQLDKQVSNPTLSVEVSSTVLHPTTSVTGGNLILDSATPTAIAAGNPPVTLSPTTTVVSGPNTYSNYVVSQIQRVPTTMITQGTSSTTITMPPGAPAVQELDLSNEPMSMYVVVASGNGEFAPQTKASYLSSTQFTVDKPLVTPVTDAVICGGICAFFNHASATTQFTVTLTETKQWAAGLFCLKGVDKSRIKGLSGDGSGASATTWYEPVK